MPIFDNPWDYLLGNEPAATLPDDAIRRATRKPLNPDEEASALKSILGAGVSGLSFAGSTLDKLFGGRAVRNIASGLTGGDFHPREMLSVLPGSDVLGLTDESQRVTGEDLAKHWGFLEGEGEKGTFELRDLVGPAIEAGLDPGTYLTFGGSALTKAGQGAKKLGALPKNAAGRIRGFQAADDVAKAMNLPLAEARTLASSVGQNIDDLVNRPLGGLAGARFPFGDVTPLGTGPKAQAVADLMAKAGDKLAYSGPGRYLSAAFDPRVFGRTDETIQRVARENAAGRKALNTQVRMAAADVAEPLLNLPDAGRSINNDHLRAAFEGVPSTFVGPMLPAVEDAIAEATSRFRQYDPLFLKIAQDAGAKVSPLDSVFDTIHAHRVPTALEVRTATRGTTPKEVLDARTGPTIRRDPILDVLGGTPELNRMVRDRRIGTQARAPVDRSGNPITRLAADDPATAASIQRAMQEFNAFDPAMAQERSRLRDILKAGGTITPAEANQLRLLNKAYRGSNTAVRGEIESMLGAAPGELRRTSRKTPSKLQQMTDPNLVGPVNQPELDRLQEIKSEADYLARRLYGSRAGAAANTLSDPAAEVIPALNTWRQDRAAERILRDEYLKIDQARLAELKAQRPQGKADLKAWLQTPDGKEYRQLAHQDQTAGTLARYLGQLRPERQQAGLFSNDPVIDSLRGWQGLSEASSRANVASDYLGRVAEYTRTPEPGMVPISKLLNRDLGLSDVAGQRILDAVSAQAGRQLKTGDLRNVFVSPDAAEQVAGLLSNGQAPSFLDPIIDRLDQFTNFFKAGVTAPFPSFHARNLVSSAWQNLTGGASGPLAGAKVMAALRAGEVPQGLAASVPMFASKGLTDAQAARELGKLMFAEQAAGSRVMAPTRELLGKHGDDAIRLADVIPGVTPQPTLKDIVTGAKLDTNAPLKELLNPANVTGTGATFLDPLNLAGREARTQTLFAPAQLGRQVGDFVDDITRGGHYIDLLRQGYTPSAAAELTQAAHFNYGNLSDFERRYMRRLVPFYCVPDHATALTRDGWKSCDELKPGDEMLTYSIASGRLEWQTCDAVNVFDCDGEIETLSNKRHTIECTSNHRWVVDNVSKGIIVKTTGELNTADKIVASAEIGDDDNSLLTPEQARLLGWLVTDGYCRQRGNHVEALIYQHPKKFLAEVTVVAGGRPRKPHPDSGVVAVPVEQARLAPLKPYLDKNKLVGVVTRLSKESALAMYDAMYKGDGTVGRRTSDFIAALHPGVRQAIVVLGFMLGKRPTLGKAGCVLSKRRFLKVAHLERWVKPFVGRVWCPTTKNGTWVMRQGNLLTITGNSYSRNVIPQQLGMLAREPGGITGQAIRVANDLRQQEGFLPPYLGGGMAIPVGSEEDGTQRYLTKLDLPFEQPLEMFSTGPGGLARTAMRALGQLNPLLKGPLELATNRQFYSGRELDDLYARTGVPVLDQVVMNSPYAKALTSYGTLADPRKWENPVAMPVNLLTGAKLSDVDMVKQRDRAILDVLGQYLQADPNISKFDSFSPKLDQLQNLTPDEILALRLNATIEKRQREAAKKAKAAVAQ